MSIEKGDATKYVHTGNGELCYELNKALTVPETFPIYLSSAYILSLIHICLHGPAADPAPCPSRRRKIAEFHRRPRAPVR